MSNIPHAQPLVNPHVMSSSYYEEVIESQKRVINAQRQKIHFLEGALGNTSIPINMRQATIAIKKLVDTSTPDENGWYRAHLPRLGETGGSSASTMSRATRNLADCTGAIEWRKETDKNDPYKEIVYIKPTDLLDRPAEIIPIKDIKRHGGDHRVARCNGCGKENIIEKKYQVCADCGEVYKTFDDRPVNTPLQDATGESEEADESTHCNLQPIPVDTVVLIARCNALDELKALPLFCCHRGKVPYNVSKLVRDFQKAKSNDPTTWTTYDQAQAIYQESQKWAAPFDGIGVMNNGDYTFVDLDHCRNKETGEMSELAQDTIALLDSYAELSQSETGVHIIVRGSIPKAIKRPEIEMYNHHRFFVWTGNHLEGTPETIADCQGELDALYKELAPEVPKLHDVTLPHDDTRFTCSNSDEEILEKGKNDAKYRRLLSGDASDYPPKKDGTPDYSRADAGLVEKFLYYGAGGDVFTIRQLGRHSGLYDEKWERDDYLERTIKYVLGRQERRSA